MTQPRVPDPRDIVLLETYQQLLQHYPQDVTVHLKMARLFSKMAAWENVFEICEDIFRLDSDQQEALFLFGEAAARSGMRTKRGIQCLRHFLAESGAGNDTDRKNAYQFLGMILEKSG